MDRFTGKDIPGFNIKKDFEEEESSYIKQPGDIIIRRYDPNKLEKLWKSPSYHAGVCCNLDEVIHLSDSTGGLMKARPGNVCRQQVSGFTHGNKFRVLRKESGAPENFEQKVKQAMNSDDQHDKSEHNCIDFSLQLLGINPEDYKKHQVAVSMPSGDLGGSTSDQAVSVTLGHENPVGEQASLIRDQPRTPEPSSSKTKEPSSSKTKDSKEASTGNEAKVLLVPLCPMKVPEPQGPGEPEEPPRQEV